MTDVALATHADDLRGIAAGLRLADDAPTAEERYQAADPVVALLTEIRDLLLERK